jgi:uncharacterized protein (DUF934 family)
MPRRLLRDGAIVVDAWQTADEWRAAGRGVLTGSGAVADGGVLADGGAVANADGVIAGPDGIAGGGGDVGGGGALMLALPEFRAERERWLARTGPLGVILAPTDDEGELVPDLARLALVAAEFPSVSEGRGYTQARLLRERWGFAGELRARGAIRRDQVFFLARCGFDSFELPEAEFEGAAAALRTFTAAYQSSNDRGLGAALRHR